MTDFEGADACMCACERERGEYTVCESTHEMFFQKII